MLTFLDLEKLDVRILGGAANITCRWSSAIGSHVDFLSLEAITTSSITLLNPIGEALMPQHEYEAETRDGNIDCSE
jgi:hypothetical protein